MADVPPPVSRWIAHAADPEGPRTPPPFRPLAAADAATLVDQAEAHGVLGAVLANLAPLREDPAFAPAFAEGRARHRRNVAFSGVLERLAATLAAVDPSLPATVVKGPVFARTIYPSRTLRTYTDVDILARPDILRRLFAILEKRDFDFAEAGPVEAPREWKWVGRENGNLLVEVHTDLVHASRLRRAVTLPYAALAEEPTGPAACLLVAVVHGGAHHYRRLAQVVDVCQAARALRTAGDEARFERFLAATNARFLAAAGLSLAARVFAEPRAAAIAGAIGPVAGAGLARRLLSGHTVMTTTTGHRALTGWRRAAFHALIRRSRPG